MVHEREETHLGRGDEEAGEDDKHGNDGPGEGLRRLHVRREERDDAEEGRHRDVGQHQVEVEEQPRANLQHESNHRVQDQREHRRLKERDGQVDQTPRRDVSERGKDPPVDVLVRHVLLLHRERQLGEIGEGDVQDAEQQHAELLESLLLRELVPHRAQHERGHHRGAQPRGHEQLVTNRDLELPVEHPLEVLPLGVAPRHAVLLHRKISLQLELGGVARGLLLLAAQRAGAPRRGERLGRHRRVLRPRVRTRPGANLTGLGDEVDVPVRDVLAAVRRRRSVPNRLEVLRRLVPRAVVHRRALPE